MFACASSSLFPGLYIFLFFLIVGISILSVNHAVPRVPLRFTSFLLSIIGLSGICRLGVFLVRCKCVVRQINRMDVSLASRRSRSVRLCQPKRLDTGQRHTRIPSGSCVSKRDYIASNQSQMFYERMIHNFGRWPYPTQRRGNPLTPPYFPTYHTSAVPLTNRERGMSTDQRASERVGELIHYAYESLLQVNAGLERLQDLIGLGMDLKQLLIPHSQMTWKFMVPQQQKFRENWDKFISSMEDANSSVGPDLRRVEAEAIGIKPAPAPLTADAARVPEKVILVMPVEVWWFCQSSMFINW